MQSRKVPPAASVLDTLSDTLLNAFSKIKKPDERFVDMKETVDKLEDNLNTVEQLYSRIGKRQNGQFIQLANFFLMKSISYCKKKRSKPRLYIYVCINI